MNWRNPGRIKNVLHDAATAGAASRTATITERDAIPRPQASQVALVFDRRPARGILSTRQSETGTTLRPRLDIRATFDSKIHRYH
jgi:hypothetical protein